MRDGGVGQGAYSSFNITHYCGDSPENVAANRALLCDRLAIDDTHLILPHQTHSTRTAGAWVFCAQNSAWAQSAFTM